METSKDDVLYTEADIIEPNKEEDKELVKVPEFDELGTAGENAPTFDELQEKGFFQNPEHPKEEDLGDKPFNGFEYKNHALEEDTVTVEMPRGLGKSTDISEALYHKEVIEKFEKETPEGMVSVVLGPHSASVEKVDMINLDELMVGVTKDYNLDSLKYPEIKKNILRAFGTLKNILIDNNDNIEMTRDDWDRFHNNVSKHVLVLKDRMEEVDKILKIKTNEFNASKARLMGKHEDIKDVEDILGPIQIELTNLETRRANIQKEYQVMKAIKTQIFAKEKKYIRMFQHVQLMIALCVMLKQKIAGTTELLDDFCANHDETTKQKLHAYIESIVTDEWLDKPIDENTYTDELAELTENSLDEQKEQAEYFKNLAIGTMYKVAEMFEWDIPIKPNDDAPEADNLVVSQISKKLMNVVNGTAPESSRFTAEDKQQLFDLIKFTDIFIGQGLEKMLENTTGIADDFKKNALKFRQKQMAVLGKHMFKDLDCTEDKKNRLISAVLLSTCKLDTLSIVFYLV
jgi:hypothetical protein